MSEFPIRLVRPLGAAFLCAALVLFAAGAYGLAARAQAEASSPLQGQVSNGTAGAPPEGIANLDVTLFQMGASGPVTQTVRTDSLGRFTFADLKLDPNSPYFARVDYEGIHYFSEILTPGIQTSNPLTLTVYETETVPADFQIDRTHLILDFAQNALTGIELLQIKNPTDRAFVLQLPLPENLGDLQFNDPRDQSRAIQGADGSLSFPILPTTDQILLGIRLNTAPPDYTLKLDVPVKVGRVNVLVSQSEGIQVSSQQLTPGPVFTPQSGSSYWQLNGEAIPAGSTVPVLISNLPGADNSVLARSTVLGLGGIAALVMLALPFVRRWRAAKQFPRAALEAVGLAEAPSGAGTPTYSPLGRGGEGGYDARGEGGYDAREKEGHNASERLALLKAIATLDDAFEAGEIAEDQYHAERAALKTELMNDSDSQT
jgi:hypothetical protein